MKKLLLILLLLAGSVMAGPRNDPPSDYSKQLRIGYITSGSHDLTDPSTGSTLGRTQNRWLAERYGWWASSVGPTQQAWVDSMRKWNPNIFISSYDLSDRHWHDLSNGAYPYGTFNDSLWFRQWYEGVNGGSMTGYDSIVAVAASTVTLRTKTGPGDSWLDYLTTPPGEVVLFHAFSNYQFRVLWNPFNRGWGNYVFSQWKKRFPVVDAIFMDNWGNRGWRLNPETGAIVPAGEAWCGTNVSMGSFWPFRSATAFSAGWNAFTVPFDIGAGFDPSVQADIDAVRDSVYRKYDFAQNSWWDALCDSMAAYGKTNITNNDGSGGYTGYHQQWTRELRHTAVMSNGYCTGEYCYFAPGDGGSGTGSKFDLLISDMRQITDSVSDHSIAWIRLGYYDLITQGIDRDRSQMNFLGSLLYLEASNRSPLYPEGRTTLYLPSLGLGQTNWYWTLAKRREWAATSGATEVDTLQLWNYAWGKYWGKKYGNEVDSSRSFKLATGTDPMSQSYNIRGAVFKHPTNQTDTLTLMVMRFAQGTNYDTVATAVNYTLPGSSSRKWYRLTSTNHAVDWADPVNGGTVITLGNAQTKIFSTDTLVANTGVVDTTISIGNASAFEGTAISFTVTLSRILTNDLTFSVSTSDNASALAGTDYTAISAQTYTITAGQTSTTVTVNTTEDTDVESDETFRVTISAPSYGTINTGTATGVILNDDSPPPVTTTNGGWLRIWQ